MIELFYMGGSLNMGILTLILVAVIAVSVINGLSVISGKFSPEEGNRKISYIKSVGLFGLVFGVFSQLQGLYHAFEAIEEAQNVSPALLAGGLKISMITTIYGLIIYGLSLLISFVLSSMLKNSQA